MFDLGFLGRILMIVGAALVAIGALLAFYREVPGLGRLPGDIVIRRESFTLYFPLGTCLILSAAGSLLLWFLTRR